MAFLYLVRHGQAGERVLTGDGQGDSMERTYDVLSDRGHRQAAATGCSLARRKAPGTSVPVISGPLNRQQDTAAHVAEELGSEPPVVDEAWREFDTDTVVAPWLAANPDVAAEMQRLADAPGDGNRRALARITGTVLEDAMGWWVQQPGFADFREQVLRGLDAAADTARAEGTAIAVTSGGVIALCAVESLGLPLSSWPAVTGRLFTASVTLFRVPDGEGQQGRQGVELLSFNEHAHLDEPDEDGRRPLRRFS